MIRPIAFAVLWGLWGLLGIGGNWAWVPEAAAQQQPAPAAKSSPAAVNLYTRAAKLQNQDRFDLAAEDWERFLKSYGSDPLASKARYYLGDCQLQREDFAGAAASFRKVLADHPKFEFVEDALLKLGWAEYSRAGKLEGEARAAQYAAAAETFSKLLTDHPASKNGDQALFFRGETHFSRAEWKQAAADYQRLLKEHPRSPLAAEANYAWGVALQEVNAHAEAGRVFDDFLTRFGDTQWADEVRMRKGETLIQAGQWAAADQLLGQVAGKQGFAAADRALSRQAYCRGQLGKPAEAAALHAQLVSRFPKSSYVLSSRLAAGRNFFRAEDWKAAQTWLEPLLAQEDAEVASEAAHWLSRAALRQADPQRAAQVAGNALPGAADTPFAVYLQLDLADARYAQPDRRADAVADYLKLATAHPDHPLAPQALYNAAFGYLELKQYAPGKQQALAFAAKYPEHELLADVRYVTGECQLQLEEYAAAEKVFADLVQQYPARAERALWQLRGGLAGYWQQNYQQVIDRLAPQRDKFPQADQRAEASFLIGLCHYGLKQWDAAAQSLRESLTAAPQWKQADETLLYLARTQREQGEPAAAIATAEQVFAQFPQSQLLDQATYLLGEFQYGQRSYPAALSRYQELLSKFPQSNLVPFAAYGAGWSHLKTRDYAAAAEQFTTVVTKFPEHSLAADAQFARGVSSRYLGEFTKGLEDVQAYLAAVPKGANAAEAHYERGMNLVGLQKFDEAIAAFAEVVRQFPEYPAMDKVYYELGWALKNSEQSAKALQAFARLAEKYPTSPLAAEAHYHVGESLYDAQKYAEAIARYQSAAKTAAADQLEVREKVAYKLGWAHFQLQDYAAAQQQFAQQLQLRQTGELAQDASFMQAESLYRGKNYAEALAKFQQVRQLPLKVEQMRVLTRLHGGQAAGQLKQWETSLELLNELKEKFPESPLLPQANYERGWALQNLKQYDQALAAYDETVLQATGELAARAEFMMGEVHFARKEYAQATRRFERVMLVFGDDAPAEVKNWQAKSGYEAARCADVQIASEQDPQKRAAQIAAAKKFYSYVAQQHPNHPLAPTAKQRLQQLDRL